MFISLLVYFRTRILKKSLRSVAFCLRCLIPVIHFAIACEAYRKRLEQAPNLSTQKLYQMVLNVREFGAGKDEFSMVLSIMKILFMDILIRLILTLLGTAQGIARLINLMIGLINDLIKFYAKTAKKQQTVKHPPGTKLLKVAEFIYSPQIYENVFQNIVSDWRLDHFQALKDSRPYKARWIDIKNYYRFFASVVHQSPAGQLFDLIIKIVK